MRSAAERLKIEIKVAEKHIGDDYGRMQDLKATLRDRKGHCELAEKELQTLKKEEEGCKKEIGTIRNQLDNEFCCAKICKTSLPLIKMIWNLRGATRTKPLKNFVVNARPVANNACRLRHRIAESRAEVDARYQGKLAKAKEDDDRSRENALKAKQESARYRLKMEELEKAYAENNIDVNALNSKIVELENSLRYLSEFNDVRLQERDEKILEMEASLNAMMEEFRSLMDVKVQLDTELLAYQKLLEGEEIRLNIIAGKGGCQAHRCAARLKKIRCPGSSSLLFSDSKTYTSKSGAIGPLTVQEIGTDGSFIRIRNTGDTVCAIGGWKIVSTAGLKEVSYRFRANQTIGPNETLAVWSNGADPMDKFESHLSMKNQIWPTDVAIKAVLQNADGVVVAWRDSILEHQVEENEEIA
uniref:LTD domain-containing protein n=1 Tax=Ditylenchus dipsaci TaxID=166011 RepID=A0A915DDS4_9BILA